MGKQLGNWRSAPLAACQTMCAGNPLLEVNEKRVASIHLAEFVGGEVLGECCGKAVAGECLGLADPFIPKAALLFRTMASTAGPQRPPSCDLCSRGFHKARVRGQSGTGHALRHGSRKYAVGSGIWSCPVSAPFVLPGTRQSLLPTPRKTNPTPTRLLNRLRSCNLGGFHKL